MKMEKSVPKRRHTKFRRRGITQKKAYILIANCITKSYIWNTYVTWQGIDYKSPEDHNDSVETCRSVIICEIIVHLLVIVQIPLLYWYLLSAVCLTTGPQTLPKRVLHTVGSSASSFNVQCSRENKTKECIWRYVNLLHYLRRKPPKCFGYVLWPSWGKCYSKDMLQRTSKPMNRYKLLIFKYTILNICKI
jgi:hypothetical protein